MTDLEAAAYEYAQAVAQEKSADECGMPSDVLRKMRDDIKSLRAQLLGEAQAYFDRVYDGAEA